MDSSSVESQLQNASLIETFTILDGSHMSISRIRKAGANYLTRERKRRQRLRRLGRGRARVAPDRICIRCKSIDLDTIFQTRLETTFRRQGILITSLEASPVELIESSCPLCRLFGCMAPLKDADGDLIMKICHLLGLSARRVLPGQDPLYSECDISLLGIGNFFDSDIDAQNSLDQTGFLCLKSSSALDMNIIDPSLFDVDFVKSCIAYCESHHGQACKTGRGASSFLRVIDCRTRQVVRAPVNCRYIALSYVWGSSTSDTILDDDLPQSDEIYLPKCPDVVENSLSVVTLIGVQYLWIDRYCIDQEDSVEKQHQIANMDAIYANSYLTIIAAAGDGPDYGLPGVVRPRKTQPHLLLDKKHIVSTLPHASAIVSSSKWASRGWTYQEGILSKRLLIFTDEQVYFECRSMYCAESLRLSTSEDQILHMESRTSLFTDSPSPLLPGNLTDFNPRQVMSCISDFSKRQLSFASDTLNALQGIFRMFAKAESPVYNLCGVPILDCGPNSRFDGKQRIDNQSLIAGLTWFHPKPIFRNENFPSWSWAGWKGEVAQELVYNQIAPKAGAQTKVATISVPKSQMTTNIDFRESLGDFSTSKINQYIYLNITTWIASCDVVHILPSLIFPGLAFSDTAGDLIFQVHSPGYFGLHLRIKFDCKFDATQTVYILEKPLLCVFLASELIPCISNTIILIVEEHEEHFERIGIAEFLGLFKWITIGAKSGWVRESGIDFGHQITPVMEFATWRRIKLG